MSNIGIYRFWVDGACSGNGTDNAWMGAGVVAQQGKTAVDRSFSLGRGTNGRAEMLSVIKAIELVPEKYRPQSKVIIYTDSKYVCGVLGGGWNYKVNHDLINHAKSLITQFAGMEFNHVQGHNGDPNNERANTLAQRAAVEVKDPQLTLVGMDRETEVGKVVSLLTDVMKRCEFYDIRVGELPDDIYDKIYDFIHDVSDDEPTKEELQFEISREILAKAATVPGTPPLDDIIKMMDDAKLDSISVVAVEVPSVPCSICGEPDDQNCGHFSHPWGPAETKDEKSLCELVSDKNLGIEGVSIPVFLSQALAPEVVEVQKRLEDAGATPLGDEDGDPPFYPWDN